MSARCYRGGSTPANNQNRRKPAPRYGARAGIAPDRAPSHIRRELFRIRRRNPGTVAFGSQPTACAQARISRVSVQLRGCGEAAARRRTGHTRSQWPSRRSPAACSPLRSPGGREDLCPSRRPWCSRSASALFLTHYDSMLASSSNRIALANCRGKTPTAAVQQNSREDDQPIALRCIVLRDRACSCRRQPGEADAAARVGRRVAVHGDDEHHAQQRFVATSTWRCCQL